MENTFQVEITFFGKILSDTNEWIDEDVTKNVTFKNLDRRNSDQHILHFLISSMMEYRKGEGGAEDRFWIEHTKMHDIAKAAINSLMVIGDGITEADKTQILSDSFALIDFAETFTAKYALPFFLASKKSGKKSATVTLPSEI